MRTGHRRAAEHGRAASDEVARDADARRKDGDARPVVGEAGAGVVDRRGAGRNDRRMGAWEVRARRPSVVAGRRDERHAHVVEILQEALDDVVDGAVAERHVDDVQRRSDVSLHKVESLRNSKSGACAVAIQNLDGLDGGGVRHSVGCARGRT